jgi:SAM-dependent methyltransferase
MSEKLGTDQIRQYWTEQARRHGSEPSASWTDRYAIELEIREILKWLKDGDRVLDVGCANGYSSERLAAQRRVSIRGIDYVPEMIAEARARAAQATNLRGNLEFAVGDVLAWTEPEVAYDAVISVRVIINLGSWEAQRQALEAITRSVRPGGLLLLSEATRQGWENLNQMRHEWGLGLIPMPPFNTYLDENQVQEALAPTCELVELSNFASSYFVGTRVLKPLLARRQAVNLDVADPTTHWNRWCAALPAAGDYGTQKLFVFQRKL